MQFIPPEDRKKTPDISAKNLAKSPLGIAMRRIGLKIGQATGSYLNQLVVGEINKSEVYQPSYDDVSHKSKKSARSWMSNNSNRRK